MLMMMLMRMVMMLLVIRHAIVMMIVVVVMFIHGGSVIFIHRGGAGQRIYLDQGGLFNRRSAGHSGSGSRLNGIATCRSRRLKSGGYRTINHTACRRLMW